MIGRQAVRDILITYFEINLIVTTTITLNIDLVKDYNCNNQVELRGDVVTRPLFSAVSAFRMLPRLL